MSRATIEQMADIRISLVGLDADAAFKYPSQLSGGMRKRASLARAMALDPELLFLDEPTSGLDPLSSDAIDELVLELKHSLGLTIVTVTHDMDSLWRIADRVALLASGRVAVEGTIEELSQSDHAVARRVLRRPSRARQRTCGRATMTSKNRLHTDRRFRGDADHCTDLGHAVAQLPAVRPASSTFTRPT